MSLRTRLTLIYGGLFLLMGVVLEAATYVVVASSVRDQFGVLLSEAPPAGPALPGQVGVTQVREQVSAGQSTVLRQLVQSSVVMLVATTVLAVVLGYVISGRIVRPLRRITETSRRLSGTNLHERIALDGPPDEIKTLADTFDGMLDRLGRAFASQRRFVANASHELRTPLAIDRALVEVAMAKPTAQPELRDLGAKLLENNARQERLIDGLLLLARAEHEPGDVVPVDLAELARSHEQGVRLELRPAPTRGDPVLLERCVANLVDNALKYGEPGGRVEVRTGTAEDGRAWLQVENPGPPITPEQARAVFEPFRRLESRVGSARGAGLGLSIVQAVTHAHGGTVEAHPRPEGSLVVTLQFTGLSHPGTRP